MRIVENLYGGDRLDKHESLKNKKVKRRKKRTAGKCSTHDFEEWALTEKGKDYLISLGMKEEDFYGIPCYEHDEKT